MTPHDVASHEVSSNARLMSHASMLTHQPRSWSKASAPRNIEYMSVTESTLQPLRSWLKEPQYLNIYPMVVTADVSHALMSSLNQPAMEGQAEHAPGSWLYTNLSRS